MKDIHTSTNQPIAHDRQHVKLMIYYSTVSRHDGRRNLRLLPQSSYQCLQIANVRVKRLEVITYDNDQI